MPSFVEGFFSGSCYLVRGGLQVSILLCIRIADVSYQAWPQLLLNPVWGVSMKN